MPKYIICQSCSICTMYIKKQKCDLDKKAKDYNIHYIKQNIYDICNLQKKCCQYITKNITLDAKK